MSLITEQVKKLRELSKQDKLGLIPWNGYSEVLNQAADTIEQLAAKQRWIPVSERLPESNVEVLVTTEWDCITIGEMFSSNDWFIHEGATNADTDDIKAWMPLPEPYKEGSNADSN